MSRRRNPGDELMTITAAARFLDVAPARLRGWVVGDVVENAGTEQAPRVRRQVVEDLKVRMRKVGGSR